jgi:prepilin-type N-terminal cleavage/methylation domain-containing protein
MRRRPGVTLIELLVVIGIITALATMIVAIAPRFGERQRASRGASQLQGWLNLAKQRALRDRRPVGLRMPVVSGASTNTVDPAYQYASQYVREVMYVEVPDESIGGTVTVPYPTNGTPDYSKVQLATTAVINPTAPNALLMPGDVLLIPGPGYAPRQIMSIQPGSAGTYQLQLDQALTATPSTTSAYRVSRRARPVIGEAVLQLPKDIAIDISRQFNPQQTSALPTWYRMFPPTANTGGGYPFDILFSPSGQVIGAEGALGSRICLWVRDVSLNFPSPSFNNDLAISEPTQLPPGPNTLITVYTRTGHITAHEINPIYLTPNSASNPNSWNPFQFTQDGLTSGN